MSKPPAGRYIIYNRTLSATGQKLAITYPGELKMSLTVSPLSKTSKQIWIIKDFDSKTFSIRSETASNLEIGWGDGPVVLPPGNNVWILNGTDSGYTIQDGERTAYWGLADAESTKVAITKDSGVISRWIFEKL